MNLPRVLVIEDHQDSRELLHLMLTRTGFQVTAVGTFKDARAEIQKAQFDLYLMDSRVPDGSGLDFCRELRRCDDRTPIVFFSALAHPSDKQAGIDAGANAYFVKPLHMAELIEALQQLLGGANACL